MRRKHLRNRLIYEIFMASLALLSVIIITLSSFSIISTETKIFKITDIILLSIFWIDYLVRIYLSDNKREFFKDNFFDFLAILPMSSYFAIFRLIRILKLAQIAHLYKITRLDKALTVIINLNKNLNSFIRTNGFVYLLYTIILLIMVSAGLMAYAENIPFSDALWWSIVTCTTVGYGDVVPVTVLGRLVAIFLMIFGIGFLGMLTSTITTFVSNLAIERNKKIKLEEQINKSISPEYVNLLRAINDLDEIDQAKVLAFADSLKKQ